MCKNSNYSCVYLQLQLVLFYLFLYPNQRRQEERNREGEKLHPCLLQTIVTGGYLRSVAVVCFVDPVVH